MNAPITRRKVYELVAECYAPVDLASLVLAQPLTIERGRTIVSSEPDIGVAWDEAAVRRYLAA